MDVNLAPAMPNVAKRCIFSCYGILRPVSMIISGIYELMLLQFEPWRIVFTSSITCVCENKIGPQPGKDLFNQIRNISAK